jgi:dipeptidyl aminopeptidase/acylaminoacyl peptidase
MFDRGLTRLAHCVFGYTGWSMLMYSVPQWFYEGDAVYTETVLSSQGRGRAASFDMSISAIAQDVERLYPYEKMSHRSYRDMIPNHYPIGYMLVTGAKRRHGADIFNRTAKSQRWYSFWPFAFGCGYHANTGERLGKSYKTTFGELKNFYTQRSSNLNVRDYQIVNNNKKRFYTSYMTPCVIGDNRILCVKSSMAKASQFVVLDTLGREVEVLGHTDAGGFDSDGNVAVYITEVPDIRWSERNYSDIAVFDLEKKTTQIVTDKCKYGAIAIDGEGKRVVVVDFSDDRICKIVVLTLMKNGDQYTVQPVKSYYSRPMEFFRCPQFVGDDKVAFISNYDNKNSIRVLDLNSMSVSEVWTYTSENIPEICPDEDGNTLYYVSDRSGIANI